LNASEPIQSTRNASEPTSLTGEGKTVAIAKVRFLEKELFDGDHVSRSLTRHHAESIVAELNALRDRLGWLPVDVEGRWRWPHRCSR
jgi:hypothetical protein